MKNVALAVLISSAALLPVTALAFNDDAYNSNPGRQQAFEHTAPGCNPGFTGAGAGLFGGLTGQGENHKGGRQGDTNDNPVLCGNANDNALTRGGQNKS